MIGTTDHRLVIDRVGLDSEGFLGYTPAELLGRSILTLVDPADVAEVRRAYSEAVKSPAGVTAIVAVRSKDDRLLRCEAVIVPLAPPPSAAFALLPENSYAMPMSSTARMRLVGRLHGGVVTAHTGPEAPGVSLLTSRELEIVRRLVWGDRVPAIAASLYLSQNTVRNHLSSVYRKLGVGSQQQLVEHFRGADGG